MDSPEEWEDDRCCVTCKNGYLVRDNDEGEMMHCKSMNEYMPIDYLCPGYENYS